MSAQLTLADAEMAALRKAILEIGKAAMADSELLSDDEAAALVRADQKLRKGLDRPSGVRGRAPFKPRA